MRFLYLTACKDACYREVVDPTTERKSEKSTKVSNCHILGNTIPQLPNDGMEMLKRELDLTDLSHIMKARRISPKEYVVKYFTLQVTPE